VYSINRLFFFSLGSVCFLLVPVFWLSLALNFSALENFVVKLSTTEFVGYPIPELLGAEKGETVVGQVMLIKIFFSVFVVAYSFLFIGLSYIEGASRRIRFCARGIAVPLFLFLLAFWLKFISDDHIISKIEKSELFYYTIVCLVVSVLLFAYSFHSRKKVKPPKSNKNRGAKHPVKAKVSPPSSEAETEGSIEDKGTADNSEGLTSSSTADLEPSNGEEGSSNPSAVEAGPSEPSDIDLPPLPTESVPPEPPAVEDEMTIPEVAAESPAEPSDIDLPPLPTESVPPEPPAVEDEMTIPEVAAESPAEPSDEVPPPLPIESVPPEPPAVEDEMIVPPMVDDLVAGDVDFVSPPEPTEAKAVLPPPTSSPPFPVEESPSTPAESIAGSYKFPSEKEEPLGDSSPEIDEKDMEELKPPPF